MTRTKQNIMELVKVVDISWNLKALRINLKSVHETLIFFSFKRGGMSYECRCSQRVIGLSILIALWPFDVQIAGVRYLKMHFLPLSTQSHLHCKTQCLLLSEYIIAVYCANYTEDINNCEKNDGAFLILKNMVHILTTWLKRIQPYSLGIQK